MKPTIKQQKLIAFIRGLEKGYLIVKVHNAEPVQWELGFPFWIVAYQREGIVGNDYSEPEKQLIQTLNDLKFGIVYLECSGGLFRIANSTKYFKPLPDEN